MADKADLLVIVPSRGRPQSVSAMVDAWSETDGVSSDAALMFCVDDDDPSLLDYCEAVDRVWSQDPPFAVHLRHGPRRRMIGTLNEAASEFCDRYSMLGFMGDDHRPRLEWVQPMRAALGYGGDGPWVAYADDGYQHEKMATSVFMTSDIVRTLGFFAPPSLTHLKADQIWPAWGSEIGRLVYLPDVIVEHMHPWTGKGVEWDAGYEECNNAETMCADAAAYDEYMGNGDFEADVEKLRGLLA